MAEPLSVTAMMLRVSVSVVSRWLVVEVPPEGVRCYRRGEGHVGHSHRADGGGFGGTSLVFLWDRSMSDRVLAVDIGGTKMASAVVSESGQVGPEQQTPTLSTGTAEDLFQVLVRLCDAALAAAHIDASDVAGIGVG